MRTFEIPLSVAPMMQRTDRHSGLAQLGHAMQLGADGGDKLIVGIPHQNALLPHHDEVDEEEEEDSDC